MTRSGSATPPPSANRSGQPNRPHGSGGPTGTTPHTAPNAVAGGSPTPSSRRRRILLIAALAVVAALIVGGGIWGVTGFAGAPWIATHTCWNGAQVRGGDAKCPPLDNDAALAWVAPVSGSTVCQKVDNGALYSRGCSLDATGEAFAAASVFTSNDLAASSGTELFTGKGTEWRIGNTVYGTYYDGYIRRQGTSGYGAYFVYKDVPYTVLVFDTKAAVLSDLQSSVDRVTFRTPAEISQALNTTRGDFS